MEINETLKKSSPIFHELLSDLGKNLFMPKGIIYQSAEAKKHAHKYNATIGMATEDYAPMVLSPLEKYFSNLESEDIYYYAPSSGDKELRETWQQMIMKKNNIKNSSLSLPVVANGLTHGILTAADLFIDQDDEIILPDKIWGNYRLIFEIRKKARFIQYPFFNENLSSFNYEGLENAINNSTREKIILLFNFPNNPTGYTATKDEQDKIVEIIKAAAEKGKKVIVIADDAYYGLFYANNIPQNSIFTRFIGLHPNIACVKIDGITKEDYAWGLRIGFITFADYHQNEKAYQVLEQKATACVRSTTSNCSRPSQSMLKKLYSDENYEKEKDKKYTILRNRAEKVKQIVYRENFSDCWDVYSFNSGYFMCLRLKNIDAEAVREYTLKNYGIGTIALGTDLRVAFSCVEEKDLEELFNIIAKSIRELKKELNIQ